MIDPCFAGTFNPQGQSSLNPILHGKFGFFSEGRNEFAVTTELFDKCIIIKFNKQSTEQKQTTFVMGIDFELKFQILRGKNVEKGKSGLPAPSAIRLTRNSKSFQLRGPPETISIWSQHLTRKLCQFGFHELFKPIREIGQGGFASVYQVQSLQNNQQYAVKAFLKSALADETHGLKGFINEVEVMRMFSHKNLMRFQGVYQSKNSYYLCVELLGQQLQEKIAGKYKFSSQEIRTIMKGLLAGVQELHAKGYMHRDLKPDNVLFRDGQCVIADFGLTQDTTSELMYFHCGTPGFLAPEIANIKSSKKQYSTACDLFSLGMIFHILVMGKSPFLGRTAEEILQQNRICKLNLDTFEYNQLPTSWLSLLKGLLEKDPKKRLTATQALAHDFFKKEPLIARNLRDKQNKEPSSMGRMSLEISYKGQKEGKQRQKKGSIDCGTQSPLLSKNIRKLPGLLREDSSVRKSKERSEQAQFPPISPLLKNKMSYQYNESRFRQLADLNS